MAKFLDKLAFLLSALASPFLTLSLGGLLIIAAYSTQLDQFFFLGLSYILFCIAVPFGFIYYEIKHGKITDLHIKNRRQRFVPLAVSLFAGALTVVIYAYFQAPAAITVSLASMFFDGLIMLLVTRFWKISLHLATLSGTITISSLMVNGFFAVLIILIPLVAWARIRRHRHTIWQVAIPSVLTPLLTLLIIGLWQTLS